MAKKPVISTVPQTTTNTVTINKNFEAIKEAFDNTLSRDGSTPNQLTTDLDLNSNDILNVDNINVNEITKDGVPVISSINASVELAQAWAANPEDSAVSGSLYSALHYAAKSEESASNSADYAAEALSAINGQYYNTRAEAVAAWATRPAGVTRVSWAVLHLPTTAVSKLSVVESTGATLISDMADALPEGPAYPDHLVSNAVIGTTDMSAAAQAVVTFYGTCHFLPSNYYFGTEVFVPSGGGVYGGGGNGFAPHAGSTASNIIIGGGSAFTATLNGDGIPENYSGFTVNDFTFTGGVTAIEVGLSHAMRVERCTFQNQTVCGIYHIRGEKNKYHDLAFRLTSAFDTESAFIIADWADSRYEAAVTTWLGVAPDGDLGTVGQDIWLHRTSIKNILTMAKSDYSNNYTHVIRSGNHQNNTAKNFDFVDIDGWICRFGHNGVPFDFGGNAHFIMINNVRFDMVVSPATSAFAFNHMRYCSIKNTRSQNVTATDFIKVTGNATGCIFENVDATAGVLTNGFTLGTLTSDPCTFIGCDGHVTVSTPALSFDLANRPQVVSISSDWESNFTDLHVTEHSCSGTLVRINTPNNTTTPILSITALDGACSGTFSISATRSGERASRVYAFAGALASSTLASLVNIEAGGTIALSSSTTSGVHTISIDTTANDWADDDVRVIVNWEITGSSVVVTGP